jgi:hypothetical protein
MKRSLVILFLMLSALVRASGSELDAVNISTNIRVRHMPYGTILDPVYNSPNNRWISGYARAGDSAIWTGHYLVAESYRYHVTKSPDALENIKRAVAGIKSLVDVTGTDLLARCLIPVTSRYADPILKEEGRHGVYRNVLNGTEYYWLGNTSRDQYSGVFYGLSIAYDYVDSAEVRAEIFPLATRMLDFLLDNNWLVRMPNGDISTTFIGRPEQQLNFLAIGRQINNGRFGSKYSVFRVLSLPTLDVGVAYDLLDDHTSYFKFNLDSINFYNLLRLEGSWLYHGRIKRTYDLLRRTTDDHRNPHFNMIDREINGPHEARDRETREMLDQWLSRPRRDGYLDLRGDARFLICGEEKACQPVPITDRIRTDFLWQRSPFLLVGGGGGNIESAGIDYILPYWMARVYGVVRD